ncbi:hypothetical protein T439DRAFT_378657 [Meredithblackwellia eburnea MCA 4105]
MNSLSLLVFFQLFLAALSVSTGTNDKSISNADYWWIDSPSGLLVMCESVTVRWTAPKGTIKNFYIVDWAQYQGSDQSRNLPVQFSEFSQPFEQPANRTATPFVWQWQGGKDSTDGSITFEARGPAVRTGLNVSIFVGDNNKRNSNGLSQLSAQSYWYQVQPNPDVEDDCETPKIWDEKIL